MLINYLLYGAVIILVGFGIRKMKFNTRFGLMIIALSLSFLGSFKGYKYGQQALFNLWLSSSEYKELGVVNEKDYSEAANAIITKMNRGEISPAQAIDLTNYTMHKFRTKHDSLLTINSKKWDQNNRTPLLFYNFILPVLMFPLTFIIVFCGGNIIFKKIVKKK